MQGFTIDANYVSLQCFRIAGTGSPGFDIRPNRTDIEIFDNFVDASPTPSGPWVGVNMPAGSELTNMPSKVHVARNYIVNTIYGLMVYCKNNCLFEDNEVYRLIGSGNSGDDNDYSRVFGDNVTLRHNYFHGNRTIDCKGADCHIDCFQTWNIGQRGEVARNIPIDRNVCFNSHEGIIARDTSSGTLGSYTSHYNWKVTNNVFAFGPEGAGNAWCALFEHVGSVTFHNNLCLSTGLVGYTNGAQGNHRNNIHYGTGWQPYSASVSSWSPGSMTADKNLLFESGRTYSGYTGSILNQDPRFVSVSGRNYRLQPGSPAIDAGASVGLLTDLDGTTRPIGSAIDIGPFEFGTSPSSPPVTIQPPTGVTVVVSQ